MTTSQFTLAFLALLATQFSLRMLLALRHLRHVVRHRGAVPDAFQHTISLESHQRAADYTRAKIGLAVSELLVHTLWLLLLTVGGGLAWIQSALGTVWATAFPEEVPGPGLDYQMSLMLVVVALGSLLDLPFSWWRHFRVDARFGFNRMSLRLWVSDLVKGVLVGAALGIPFLVLVLWLMDRAAAQWWIWAWAAWIGFQFVVLVLWPTLIAPLFNRFEPLEDGPLRERVEALLRRCGFSSKGLFVMDGSRRSAHGNAYFTGMGRAKRIVFFDTLMNQLRASEIEAVLAHELGHFRHQHILQRMLVSAVMSLAALALLGWMMEQPWFYRGLGLVPLPGSQAACALILFALALPAFLFPLQPLMSWWSRRHEFEADAYAAQQTQAADLISALVKMYEDNAATLTPDPLHSAIYDSHPPAPIRIARLRALASTP
jgi:STE24 endopeptidase